MNCSSLPNAKVATSLIASLILGGCASSHSLVTSGPSAKLSIHLASQSQNTNVQAWRISSYDDQTCVKDEDGTLAARKVGNSGGALESFDVPAEKPVTLGFWYSEARYAQNRECSYTLTFSPAANGSYSARFEVADGANACRVLLNDSEGQPVATSTPVLSCAKTQAGKVPNGGTGILNWKFNVTAVPAR